jgi:hypothetical protein
VHPYHSGFDFQIVQTLDIMRDVPSITVFFFAKNLSRACLVLFQDTFWPRDY